MHNTVQKAVGPNDSFTGRNHTVGITLHGVICVYEDPGQFTAVKGLFEKALAVLCPPCGVWA
jgi:hypothetical protein